MQNRTFFGASLWENDKSSTNSQPFSAQPSWEDEKVDWIETVLVSVELLSTELSPFPSMCTFKTVICDVSELSSVLKLSPQ